MRGVSDAPAEHNCRPRRAPRSHRVATALGGLALPRFGRVPHVRWGTTSLARDSHTLIGRPRGLVSVPEPVVSDSGLAPGHPSGRWGDFPHVQQIDKLPLARTGTPLPFFRLPTTFFGVGFALRANHSLKNVDEKSANRVAIRVKPLASLAVCATAAAATI